nr:carboxypeptidase-like regulatory domain-containing protein [Thermoanaerobaculia bacterium]
MKRIYLWLMAGALLALPAQGQQTGAVEGRITLADGSSLPGATVEATSPVLPQPRVTTTNQNGDYRLVLLPPGEYELTFNLSGMAAQKRKVVVLLQQTTFVSLSLSPEAVAEAVTVVAEAPTIDLTSAEVKTAIPNKTIDLLPVGQE